MITDRLEGVWERSAVAGVKAKEMLNVHITLQSTVIMLQVRFLFNQSYQRVSQEVMDLIRDTVDLAPRAIAGAGGVFSQ